MSWNTYQTEKEDNRLERILIQTPFRSSNRGEENRIEEKNRREEMERKRKVGENRVIWYGDV